MTRLQLAADIAEMNKKPVPVSYLADLDAESLKSMCELMGIAKTMPGRWTKGSMAYAIAGVLTEYGVGPVQYEVVSLKPVLPAELPSATETVAEIEARPAPAVPPRPVRIYKGTTPAILLSHYPVEVTRL